MSFSLEQVVNILLDITDLGIDKLEEKYGIKGEILTDDNIHFYKNQIVFLRQLLDRKFMNAEINTKDRWIKYARKNEWIK